MSKNVYLSIAVLIMKDQLITISPDILGGTPVFYGTRVPVKNLFDYLKSGESIKDFLKDFSSVTRKHALKVLSVAESILTITAPGTDNEAAA